MFLSEPQIPVGNATPEPKKDVEIKPGSWTLNFTNQLRTGPPGQFSKWKDGFLIFFKETNVEPRTVTIWLLDTHRNAYHKWDKFP